MSNLDANGRSFLLRADIIAFASEKTRELADAYRAAIKARKAALAETYTADYQSEFRTVAKMGMAYTKPWMKDIDARLGQANRVMNAATRALDAALLSDVDLWNGLAVAHAEAEARFYAALAAFNEADEARKLYQQAGRSIRPMRPLVADPVPGVPSVEVGQSAIGVFPLVPQKAVDDRDVFGGSTVDAPAAESTVGAEEPAPKPSKRSSHPGLRAEHYGDVI